jgi:hypothetical protein
MHAQFDPFATLDDDYAAAVVRMTWSIDRASKERFLLCGCVELLPREVPHPEPTSERFTTLSRRYYLYARDVVVSAQQGLAWFSQTEKGVCLRPDANGAFSDPNDAKLPRFATGTFSSEPPAPATVAPTTRIPFGANWHGTPRVRHLIPTGDICGRFTPAELQDAAKWLESELHVSLDLLPEFWGSVHLIAPNPIFRSLRVRHQRDDRDRSSLVFTLTPRAGRSVVGLQMVVEEERASGLGVLASMVVHSPITRLELATAPGSIRERVIDPSRGVLYDAPFGVFDVGLALRVNVANAQRTVAPTGPDDPGYSVPLVGGFRSESHHEGRKPLPAARVLRQAAADRTRRQYGEAHQRWFRNRAADGITALREVIGKVESEVLICDPYFGGDDVRRLVLAIADPQARVRILASAMHLHRARTDVADEARYMMDRLTEARNAQPMNPIEVRVMRGKRSPIHDRFLWSKDRLWMLGSSVNRFGDRGTLMVVVPDPDPVVRDLEQVWVDSPELTNWATARATGSVL